MTGLSKNDKFIQKAKLIFNNKYDYFNDFTSLNKKIKIKCNEHNEIFEVLPRSHLITETGSCPKCKTNNNKKIKSISSEYFINKSIKLFGNKFNYSKVNYTNKKGKIILSCNKHNIDFEIEPKSHYYSKTGGCNDCNNEINKLDKKELKCYDYNNVINKSTKHINQICYNCIKIRKHNIIDIGKKIEYIIKLRLTFVSDEYIKKINIDGLENYYVSNYGKIFNSNKRLLNGYQNQKGYIDVRLLYNEKNTLFKLHRLICTTFNGYPKDNKNIVDHINKIKNDNRSINLRWVNQKENMNNKSTVKINIVKQNIQNIYFNLKKEDEEFKIITKSIYGNFNNYSISNYGRIKNIKKNKLLIPRITDEGYMYVSFYTKNIPIHRLVCEFFNVKSNINHNENVVNHINENKQDNYYKNLEWVSIKKNNQHSKNISINMLDDNKKIIKIFNSYTDAYKYFNKNYTGFINNQIDKDKKAYGYYWSINKK